MNIDKAGRNSRSVKEERELSQVSYRAFLLRLRKLAEKALESYGFEQVRLRFVNYSGNGLYQVSIPSGSSANSRKYALRLHQPNYMKPKYISSEMEWLSALNQAGIHVPEPIPNLNGEWLTVVEGEFDMPRERTCTLLGWTEGRLLKKSIRPKHLESLGRVVGRMHRQSRSWKKPDGFARPHWDWEGLYGNGFDYGFSVVAAREAIPKAHQYVFNEVLEQVREASEQLGKGRSVYGLIHADLSLGDNIAFFGGEARPFDFDDCGFGYWVFDLGVTLAHYMSDFSGISPNMRDALIAGYGEMVNLEGNSQEYLDLFIAARYAQLMLFYQGGALRYPQHREEAIREVNSHANELKRILKRMPK